MLRINFVLIIVAFVLGQFSNISSLTGISGKIYIFDLLVFLYAITGLTRQFLIKKSFYVPLTMVFFIFFTLWATIISILQLYNHPSGHIVASFMYLLRWAAYLSAGLVTANLVEEGVFSAKFVHNSLVYSAIVLVLLGILQLIMLPDLSVLDSALGWDPHKNRMTSTFFDPNFLGAYFVMALTVLLLKKQGNLKQFLFIMLGLFLTYSRSAWGMFGILILILGLKRSLRVILLSLVLFLGAYFAVPRIQTRLAGITDPADSAHFRLISWNETLNIIEDNFYLGVGFNFIKPVKQEYGFITHDNLGEHGAAGADSSILLVFATTGIIGFLTFLSGFLLPAVYKPSLFAFSLALTLLLGAQFVNSLFYPQIMFFWLTLYALEKYN